MAILYGKEFTRWELMKRIGDISQIAGARQMVLNDGKCKGVGAVEVKNGNGLNFTVLPDRGMDIAWADYKGTALSFISKTGVVSPAYYQPEGNGFLRSFYGGLLTTCGLTYMGSACVDEGISLGLHGRTANIPAEDVSVSNEWHGDEFEMCIRGRIRESVVFGENITLSREIRVRLGENRISIKDIVENCGFEKQPLMLLYHCNFGYPLLDTGTKLIFPEGTVRARDPEAQKGINQYEEFSQPVHNYQEQVFYHDLKSQENGKLSVSIYNEKLMKSGLGVSLNFNKNQFPIFIEWKQVGEGDYVVGLEPATCYPEGRDKARERGGLPYIEPGEQREFQLEFVIEEGQV